MLNVNFNYSMLVNLIIKPHMNSSTVVDPGLELMGGGGGGCVLGVLLPLPACLSSVICSFLPKIRGEEQDPPLDRHLSLQHTVKPHCKTALSCFT